MSPTVMKYVWNPYQRHGEDEEPGVNEEVLAAHLDDVDEQRRDGQRHRQRHQQLLHQVFEEEAQCLQVYT